MGLLVGDQEVDRVLLDAWKLARLELVEERAWTHDRKVGCESEDVLVAGHEHHVCRFCESEQIVVARIRRTRRRVSRIVVKLSSVA